MTKPINTINGAARLPRTLRCPQRTRALPVYDLLPNFFLTRQCYDTYRLRKLAKFNVICGACRACMGVIDVTWGGGLLPKSFRKPPAVLSASHVPSEECGFGMVSQVFLVVKFWDGTLDGWQRRPSPPPPRT